ncbi:tyrosine-protein phosphatase [Siminovitchia terrae]|uniref:tyrosine-protein phosphatase n=1 Tax=Siminovitchia terrae TaxID=1914933 RepID=UPI0028AFA358|nr:CpsB/CapC family capsule biosynthesis tyrosine phosphatase [Siminovitchia terrae]
MIVDIHNHIFPNLDDGPQNWEEMTLLAKQAAQAGITHVIATPHHKHRHKEHFYENDPSVILLMTEKVNQRLKKMGIPLSVHPGVEFHLHENILKEIDNSLDDFLTLNNNGKYILMEPPSRFYPDYIDKALLKLKEIGLIPILAHPERNRELRKNPKNLYHLVENGILIQVTAASVLGIHGRRLKNFALHLLDHHLVHFIASDAHHFVRRKFELMNAYEYIKDKYSLDSCEYFKNNAIHALEGTDIKVKNPKKISKKRQYFFLYNHPLNQI